MSAPLNDAFVARLPRQRVRVKNADEPANRSRRDGSVAAHRSSDSRDGRESPRVFLAGGCGLKLFPTAAASARMVGIGAHPESARGASLVGASRRVAECSQRPPLFQRLVESGLLEDDLHRHLFLMRVEVRTKAPAWLFRHHRERSHLARGGPRGGTGPRRPPDVAPAGGGSGAGAGEPVGADASAHRGADAGPPGEPGLRADSEPIRSAIPIESDQSISDSEGFRSPILRRFRVAAA